MSRASADVPISQVGDNVVKSPAQDLESSVPPAEHVKESDLEKSCAEVTSQTSDDDSNERVKRLGHLLEDYGSTWDGVDDPNDPYNWSSFRKITIAVVFSIGQLITLMSASVAAAALDDISHDLRIDPSTTQITFSVYFLGLGFAPFLVAAFSELTGRKFIWAFCNAWFILWNALCPVGYSAGLMIVGRLMAGAGAAAGITLTGPVMADMYPPEERGKSLAIASLLPYLGPALGPIVGGLLTELVAWPWLFYVISIFNGAVLVLGLLLLRESYTPVLLRRKTASQGNASPPSPPWSIAFWREFMPKLSVYLLRPVKLLVHRPVIQLISFLIALNFGIYTLLLSTFAMLFMDIYHESAATSSLHYIAISVGTTVSAQIGGRVMDLIYRRLRERNKGQRKPEYRVPYMIIGVVLIPAGLFWYGWAAQSATPWIIVDLGVAVFTCGSFMFSQALLAYQLDEFAEFGASANAASRLFSNILGFAFPIFAPQLHKALGYGWGTSLLAFIFILFGVPVTLALWRWGERIRARGRTPAQQGRI
ncbi:putative efflux pump antibiotic resistance protein [Xylariaceae sp. AK1471]|nr:putative efflux pump antibiotic resistance protein [Xylariaceae sp. AK1471]